MSDRTSTDSAERTYSRAEILEMLTIFPCHITGTHNPSHTTQYVCADQKAHAVGRLLDAIGATTADLPHSLEPGCGWCHSVPSQEEYREKLRELHRWAGTPISAELAAPAPDAPCFDVPERVVLKAMKRAIKQADGWVKWADLVAVIDDEEGNKSMIGRVLSGLDKAGKLLYRNGHETGYSAQWRLP